MVDRLVLAQRLVRAAVLEEVLQLLPCRDFRRAQQARHGEGAAGIGPGGADLVGLVLQPAAQEARHEGIACAQHVVDFDGEALADDAAFEGGGNCGGIDNAAHGAALQHDDALRQAANGAERLQRVLAAAGDVHLLLGADDQVAVGEDGLQVGRHHVRLDVALLARAMTGEAPEVRTVVDVNDDAAAMFFCERHGLALGRVVALRAGEMRAGDQDRGRRADEVLVDVGLGQRAESAQLSR